MRNLRCYKSYFSPGLLVNTWISQVYNSEKHILPDFSSFCKYILCIQKGILRTRNFWFSYVSRCMLLGWLLPFLNIWVSAAAVAAAKLLQSCPTLCNPIDDSPPGSPVPGILQARTLEWVAISFSNAWKWKVKVKSLSWVRLLVTPWTAAYQAPPSMGFSRREYWSRVP